MRRGGDREVRPAALDGAEERRVNPAPAGGLFLVPPLRLAQSPHVDRDSVDDGLAAGLGFLRILLDGIWRAPLHKWPLAPISAG